MHVFSFIPRCVPSRIPECHGSSMFKALENCQTAFQVAAASHITISHSDSSAALQMNFVCFEPVAVLCVLHSHCEFICMPVLLCLEDPVSLASSTTSATSSAFTSAETLRLERRVSKNTYCLGLSAPKSLCVHFPVVGSCVVFHLLQLEAS